VLKHGFKEILEKMSSIIEKIHHNSTNEIKLYKEGVFWIAYEQSAYYLAQKKGYKATKKLVKSIGQEVVSIGFPPNAYDSVIRVLPVFHVESSEAGCRIIRLQEEIDLDAFLKWKSALALRSTSQSLNSRASQASPSGTFSGGNSTAGNCSSEVRTLLIKLRDFSLADKTPLECMLFLSELKNHDYGNV
jgi:hypothetical protein